MDLVLQWLPCMGLCSQPHGQHMSFLGTWRQELHPKQQAGYIWRDGACWALGWEFLDPGKMVSSLRAACFGQCCCWPSENCSLGLNSLCHLFPMFSVAKICFQLEE